MLTSLELLDIPIQVHVSVITMINLKKNDLSNLTVICFIAVKSMTMHFFSLNDNKQFIQITSGAANLYYIDYIQ